ncbi:MTH1187 family thiamine-binding protein [Carboxylicivirga sp. M1479]|uniref:MTH1187 family thiamine-binding protein n=1 Tax=Carboxylicivirga sp. M1479 TaxID=2594476 RepID=UPI001178C44B|nr:MTH1187 family thiamine-binding protein [Carboxylicivirga sp. M1479]TRX62351.1 MTH1187 family thiamine-binding protein [Carboxylicivirga sp. M1479]
MSVLLNFAMFPTDKGDSVSQYVSQIIKHIKESGYPYKLNPMGTTVETETMEQALKVVQDSYDILDPISNRVYCSINIDAQKNKSERISSKIASVEAKIGEVSK